MESISEVSNCDKTLSLPYEYCIPNKARKTLLKILHNIDPTNVLTQYFVDIDHSLIYLTVDILLQNLGLTFLT